MSLSVLRRGFAVSVARFNSAVKAPRLAVRCAHLKLLAETFASIRRVSFLQRCFVALLQPGRPILVH